MIWHIQEDFTISEIGTFILWLERDDCEIKFHADEIDSIVDALKRAKSHFSAKEAKEAEIEALARWGKAKIPVLD